MGKLVGGAHDGTGGKRADGCDSPFHAESAVSRDGDLDLTYEAGMQDVDGEG